MEAALGSDGGAVREAAAGRIVVAIPTLDEEQSIADVVRSIPRPLASRVIAAGRLAGWGIRLLYGVRYTDMCALRAIRRHALLELGMRELTYGWNIEMQMRAARAGLRILEIPVDYRRRRGGNSKVAGSVIGTIRAGARILATFARISIEPSRRARSRSGAG